LARFAYILLSIILLSGCALQSTVQEKGPVAPRSSAALQLTQEGIQHLNAGRPDNAIRSFEQAISLDPNYGQCYYYMAQAWMAKGVVSEAMQFNDLARDYLKDQAQWEERVFEQTLRIERMSR
jgi:Tfp pilus assembly protein PilF